MSQNRTKIVKTAALLIIAVVLRGLGWGIYSKANAKAETARRVARLPEVSFKGLDGRDVLSADWKGKSTWVVFFHSDCHYCQMEADNIREAEGLRTQVAIKLISTEPADTLRAFAARYGLDTLHNVQLLTDPNHANYLTFGATSTPTSFLYDAEGALIEKFSGVVKGESVLRFAGK